MEQAKVIRRLTWAARSLGTIEYTDDPYEEETNHAAPPTDGATNIATEMLDSNRGSQANGTEADANARRYINRFKCRGDSKTSGGRRLIPLHFGRENLDRSICTPP